MIPLEGFPTSPSWTQGFFRPAPEASVGRAEVSESSSRLEPFLNAAEKALDFLAVTLAVYSAYALYRVLGAGQQAQYPASAVLLGAGGSPGFCRARQDRPRRPAGTHPERDPPMTI